MANLLGPPQMTKSRPKLLKRASCRTVQFDKVNLIRNDRGLTRGLCSNLAQLRGSLKSINANADAFRDVRDKPNTVVKNETENFRGFAIKWYIFTESLKSFPRSDGGTQPRCGK